MNPTEDPRFGVVGKQKIESIGQVTKKRMETYDDETIAQSIDFMKRAVKDDKPFFVWHNTTLTHAGVLTDGLYCAGFSPDWAFINTRMT